MRDNIDRVVQETQSQLDNQIRKITQAHIATDDIDCIDCGEPIGDKRKQAVPWAVRCVGCQWQFERTHDGGR